MGEKHDSIIVNLGKVDLEELKRKAVCVYPLLPSDKNRFNKILEYLLEGSEEKLLELKSQTECNSNKYQKPVFLPKETEEYKSKREYEYIEVVKFPDFLSSNEEQYQDISGRD